MPGGCYFTQEESGGLPGAGLAAKQDELAEMIGVVIGDEHGFTQDGLALAVRDASEEIRFRVLNQFDHGAQIGVEIANAAVPGGGVGRSGGGRPVAGRERRRDVAQIAAEFEDVPLGDAEMFEQLPERVSGARDFLPAEGGRDVLQDASGAGVGLLVAQQAHQVAAEGAVTDGGMRGASDRPFRRARARSRFTFRPGSAGHRSTPSTEARLFA